MFVNMYLYKPVSIVLNKYTEFSLNIQLKFKGTVLLLAVHSDYT